jgi:hypothetical protein
MSFSEKIKNGLLKNPFAWVLLALLVCAEYAYIQRTWQKERVCELLSFVQPPAAPPGVVREAWEICLGRQPP